MVLREQSKFPLSKISRSIGDGYKSDPVDIIRTRQNLHRLGLPAGEEDRGYIDRHLDRAIRNFQKKMNLKVDGIMNPNGETENALNTLIVTASNNKNSDNGEEMPSLPPGHVDREELPAPPTENIPGTNIPDHGKEEYAYPDKKEIPDKMDMGIYKPVPNSDMDHGIFVDPRVFMDDDETLIPLPKGWNI